MTVRSSINGYALNLIWRTDMSNDVTYEAIDLSNEIKSLENVSLKDLENVLYEIVKKEESGGEGDSTFAA